MTGKSESKAFGSMMLFFITLLSYTPLKTELVSITVNASLTSAGAQILNSIFGIIWIMLAVMFLGVAVVYAIE